MALKIITGQFLGNEAARSRFLREARAAASVRHPNVATVFHLGESGGNYFYAMEFVDGEMLESLIRRHGRLEIDLALDIMAQVAAGLTAIHKQHLVHRDPPGCAYFGWLLCRSSVKDHSGYSPSSLRASSQNTQQRRYPQSLTWCTR